MNVGKPSMGVVLMSGALLFLPGCGSNIEEALFQAASATGRTSFDLFLTDFANALAGQLDEVIHGAMTGGDANNGDTGNGDTGGGTTDGGGGTTDGGGLDGGALFAANCAACHGADGASGFAPDITGSTADDLTAAMTLATHSSITLSDAELAAIATWLGGGAGSGTTDGGATGDAGAGETLFTANACGACHCADASGGCALEAPSIQGVSTDLLDSKLRGNDAHTGGKFGLSDQDIADLGAYLASL